MEGVGEKGMMVMIEEVREAMEKVMREPMGLEQDQGPGLVPEGLEQAPEALQVRPFVPECQRQEQQLWQTEKISCCWGNIAAVQW